MALLTRARGAAITGVTAFALALPVAPVVTSTAAAAPAPVTSAAVSTSVASTDRTPSTSRSARFAVRARKVMRVGNSLKGVPYRYGGSTPRGFDCSGFTSYVYRKVGVKLPRRASLQRRSARWISRSAARPGDLVFFHRGGRVYHVGIYAGNNRVLHSPRPGQRVHTARIWTRSVTFGRVL